MSLDPIEVVVAMVQLTEIAGTVMANFKFTEIGFGLVMPHFPVASFVDHSVVTERFSF